MHATGFFDVQITPTGAPDTAGVPGLGRMSVKKQFHGDLDATSDGEMLAVSTEVKGSAVYVVIERVTATLGGQTGTFALVHKGVLTRGAPEQSITVVPDSGTGGLAGLAGTLTITVSDRKHFYDLEYTLAPS